MKLNNSCALTSDEIDDELDSDFDSDIDDGNITLHKLDIFFWLSWNDSITIWLRIFGGTDKEEFIRIKLYVITIEMYTFEVQ